MWRRVFQGVFFMAGIVAIMLLAQVGVATLPPPAYAALIAVMWSAFMVFTMWMLRVPAYPGGPRERL